MRVVLTQPQPRVNGLAIRLAAAGHQVNTLGFQKIFDRVLEAPIAAQLQDLARYDWVIPVSPNAIDALSHFMSLQAIRPGGRVALIGPGSLERWQHAFAVTDWSTPPLLPRGAQFDANALLAEPEFGQLAGQRVAIIQGSPRIPVWATQLRARGAQVAVIAAYRVEAIAPTSEEIQVLGDWLSEQMLDSNGEPTDRPNHRPLARQTVPPNQPIAIVVSSAANAQACSAWVARSLPPEWRVAMNRCLWLTNHPNVTQALQQAGWQRLRTLRPGEASLLQGLESGG